MRSLWAALLVACLTLSMPVSGQAEPANLVEDASGDVAVSGPDGSSVGQDPSGEHANADLVGVGVLAEDDESVTFYAEVASLSESSSPPAPFSDPQFYLYFLFGEKAYRLRMILDLSDPVGDQFPGRDFALLEEEGSDGFRAVEEVEMGVEASDNMAWAKVPRAAIVDESQAPLAKGRALSDFWAWAEIYDFDATIRGPSGDPLTQVGPPSFWDRAPDDGVGLAYTMLTGRDLQAGQLFAAVDRPVRWTNGEATTFNYGVQLTNRGDASMEVLTDVTGWPDIWTVAFPELVQVPAGGFVNVSILVTVPFTHQHGNLEWFDATFSTADKQHRSQTQLGVYWPAIPQPAGHHNVLTFHGAADPVDPPFDAAFSGVDGWFNAAEGDIDEADEGATIPADFSVPSGVLALFGGGEEGIAYWNLPQSPPLRMGLDFFDGETGTFTTTVIPATPVVDARLEAALLLEKREGLSRGFNNERELTTLALGQSEVASGPSTGPTEFIVEMSLTEDAVYRPYAEDTNLVMILLLRGHMAGTGFFSPEEAVPHIDPGVTTLTMPFREFHDPVDFSFVSDRSLQLHVGESGQERRVNPGKTVVYDFELAYDGGRTDAFQVSLSGSNTGWARILGPDQVEIVPGEATTLALAIDAPEDARAGDIADVTLRASSARNAAVEAVARTITTVVTDVEIADESDKADRITGDLAPQESPLGVGLLLVALALGLAYRRRS